MRHNSGTTRMALSFGFASMFLLLVGCGSEAGETDVSQVVEALTSPMIIMKSTLSDTTNAAPSLKWRGNTLVMAYKGMDSKIYIMNSADCGQSFANRIATPEYTSDGPSVSVGSDPEANIAWIGNGNNQINVASINVDNTLGNKHTFSSWTSPSGPSIAWNSNRDRIYLAWRGTDNRVRVAISADKGETFGGLYTSTEYTDRSPVLAAGSSDNTVYVAWKGNANTSINFAKVAINGDTVTGLVNKNTMPFFVAGNAPGLTALSGNFYLAWATNTNRLNLSASADNGATFSNRTISSDYSNPGPGLGLCFDYGTNTAFPVIAWPGNGNNLINVAHLKTD